MKSLLTTIAFLMVFAATGLAGEWPHMTEEGEDTANLVVGRDAKLEVTQEYRISASSTADMLVPASPAKALSDTQRIDLKNLIDLPAEERKPYKTKAQQDGGGQPATRPESK
jgi:hypothetical protein